MKSFVTMQTKKCQRLKQHQLFFRNRIKYLSERESEKYMECNNLSDLIKKLNAHGFDDLVYSDYCELLCEHEKSSSDQPCRYYYLICMSIFDNDANALRHKLEAKVEETLKFEKLKSEDVWNAELDNLNNAIKDILGCIVR